MSEQKHDFRAALADDPNWASFLYLTDELSAEESDLFENQLAERQDLQAALIETTRQLACLSSAKTAQPLADRSLNVSINRTVEKTSPLKAIAVVVSLAACVAIAVLVSSDHFASDPIGNSQSFASTTQAAFQPSDSAQTESELDVMLAWVNISNSDVFEEDDTVDSNLDLSVPDWMMTAVLLEAEEMGQAGDPAFRSLPPAKNSDSI